MKKSMWIAFVFMAAALIALPVAYACVDSEKKKVTITEEVLSGDPEAARGITLRIGTEADGHLIWNTDYTVGGGGGYGVRFDFFPRSYGWMDSKVQLKAAGMEFNSEFYNGFAMGSRDSDTAIGSGNWLLPEIVSAVAGRTASGEERSETVRLCDYYKVHPVNFYVSDWPNMRGYYSSESSVFGEFFHIAVEEDRMLEMTVKKNDAGDVVFLECDILGGEEGRVSEVSAFGEDGCYYAYNYEDSRTGKSVDRGQNSGIFYISFKGHPENSLLLPITTEQVKKVCELPQNAVPVQMLLDEDAKSLYLMLKGEQDFSLAVYALEDGGAVLRQCIPVLSGETAGEDAVSLLTCVRMTVENGGILVGWENGRFSYLTEEEGNWQLWCAGAVQEAGFYLLRDMECYFDGERLALAYFVLPSADVQLHVYRREGLVYSGVYRHSGSWRQNEPALWNITDEYGTCMRALNLKME